MSIGLLQDRVFGPHLRVRRWALSGPSPWHAPPGAHPGVEVAWVHSGEIRYQLDRHHFTVRAGELMLVPSGYEHRTSVAPGTRAGSAWLGEQMMRELGETSGGSSFRTLAPRVVCPAEALLSVAQLLEGEAFLDTPEAALAADALGERLAVRVLRAKRRARSSRMDARIRSATERIRSEYDRPLSVEALARDAELSRFHFSRRFQEQVGLSPYQYLLEVRLHRAAERLRCRGKSVTEAALESGFTELGRFSQRFRQYFGCSPSRFAAQRRGKAPER